ncbi:hypothetical protein [Epilithonimonas hungarica]|uniref:Uncharacterized protein n=1 Tax=Epilithonimonas hungarica TaxID=454006 RepID=A0A1G7G5B4_9FLAO|nr:hypothetical protein [Epilithonimonas hungarica]SDE83287.1 hypothetical protein SAMN05421825_0336 [Epilithonimonas hungarica]
MYEKKKILVKTVFDETKKMLPRGSKSSVAAYLSLEFEKRFGFSKDERTFVRFYTSLVEKGKDYDIDDVTLDWFSESLGYKDYKTFCSTHNFSKVNDDSSITNVNVTFDDEARSLVEKLSQIVVNITTTPVFKLPEFLTKQSNLGIMGAILCGSLVVGSKMYKADEGVSEKQDVGKRFGLLQTFSRQCMYWNGKEYIPEDCNNTRNGLIAIDAKLIANFKKITQPDTIRSIKGIWYSKYQNEVEFFTADGKNPDNNTELHQLTDHMLNKYILPKDSIEE